MDKPLLSTLTTIDNALTSLTDSITAYTPSLISAQTLLKAESQLNDHLTKLHTHVSNEIQLAHLHSLAANLEARYKNQIKALAAVRSEILAANIATPVTISSGEKADSESGHQAVDYKQVLAFARNISRFTAPKGFKPPSVLRAEDEAKAAIATSNTQQVTETNPAATTSTQAPTQADQTSQPNANTAPASAVSASTAIISSEGDQQHPAIPPSSPNPINDHQAGGDSLQTNNGNNNKSLLSLTSDPNLQAWLSPPPGAFTPWPSIEQFARSSVARSTGWIGAAEIPPDEAALTAEEEEKRRLEEEQQRERARKEAEEENEKRRARERNERMGSSSQGAFAAGAGEPSQFMDLDLYNPDEE